MPLDAVAGALAAARERSELGAFWALTEERALATAKRVDAGTLRGAPLAGVPVAVKDSFDLAGVPTTGGLRGLFGAAVADASAVRLLEAAGAVVIGKTAMDPIAWSTHGQAPGFPPCRNPVSAGAGGDGSAELSPGGSVELSPGGSSAGSAVAVAAGIAPLGLGTDTACSVRVPAAYCGVVGMKPAFGEVPLHGCLPLAPSFDTAGVIGRSVRECAVAVEALAGKRLPVAGPPPGPVAVLTDLLEASEAPVVEACEQAISRLGAAGVHIEEVALGWWAPGLGVLLASEIAATWTQRAHAEPERFPPEILAAIERGSAIPATRAEAERAELRSARSALEQRLGRFAALLSPTVPTRVPTVDAENVATSTRFTRIFSALGWPALSVPCGHDDRGAPVGMHVTGARGLAAVVAVAEMVERSAGGRS